jgi:uncharacterized protein (DUF2336 family)
MAGHPSLIGELEQAIQNGSKDKRVETLRRVADLFLMYANRFGDEQIVVFEDVMGRLIEDIETKALWQLSQRLAPVDNAPTEVIRRLAWHDEIAVAAPVLTQSARLTGSDLAEIARTKGQGYLLAISSRPELEELVTDILLQRGDRDVLLQLANNLGAKFSQAGFATLVKRSETDDRMAEKVGSRLDIPMPLFRELVTRATDSLRSRLLTLAGPDGQAEIRRIQSALSNKDEHQGKVHHDYAGAQRLVRLMQSRGEFGEPAVLKFATLHKYAEMIVALSLLLQKSPEVIDRLIQCKNREPFLILCKTAGFEWPTVRAIFNNRSAGQPMANEDLALIESEYAQLSKGTAPRAQGFLQGRQTVSHKTSAS